ncbi:MAG TPA: hypothetical protein VGM94_09195 [Galbitalea sp.]|jgi:hypothetical protein
MQWWNDIVSWFNSSEGTRVITTAILPFIAIVVAGLVAAWIASGFARRIIDHQDREIKAAAIMALIGAGRRAALWSSLGGDEKQHVDALISESDLRMRLLPVAGAIAAADWATHELNAMKKNSASFSFQAEQTFFDFRDRLLDWQARPRRAKKLFAFDLVQWQYDDDSASQSSLVAQQREWASDHVEPPTGTTPTAATAATTTGASTQATAAPSTPSLASQLAAAPPPLIAKPASETEVVPATAATPLQPAAASTPVQHETGTAPISIPVATESPDDDDDDDAGAVDDGDDAESPYSPPVTAGTVRNRIAPERRLDD